MSQLKLPYGISNFKRLRDENYLYVDKTPYIQRLENLSSRYLFFVRPRRFGKSLFLSMLEHYYDLAAKDDFDRLFGDLYIGKHPTILRNQYLVLSLDFSGLNTANAEELEKSFKQSLVLSIARFRQHYKGYFNEPYVYGQVTDPGALPDVRTIWIDIVKSVEAVGHKLYLIIDEYDHFANDIIAMGDAPLYQQSVRAAGFVRDFYEAVKISTKTVVDRIFITGTSPIMLDDLTSGFNISENLSMNLIVNEMLGFTEEEVKTILNWVDPARESEALMDELRKNYNGYLFNEDASTKVYNPDMVLYFLNQWQMTGRYPKQLVDENVKTDYGRLHRLLLNERNRRTLEDIIINEEVMTNIVCRFSFDRMFDEEYFVSLLFYLGLLSIRGTKYGQTELAIPNYVIKTIFWEYFERRLREMAGIEYKTVELAKAVWEMAFSGRVEPFVQFIRERVLKVLSNRDLIRLDEKHIKLVLLSYLSLTSIYRPISERETQNGNIDLYLEQNRAIPDLRYEWLLELKYLKESETSRLEAVTREGLDQLKSYAQSFSQGAAHPRLRKALLVFHGKDEIYVNYLNE